MKQSKILKVISYIMIPILIGAIILSIFSITVKDNVYYNEEKYYSSELFASSYIYSLSNPICDLIHDNIYTKRIQDEDMEIRYSDDESYYNLSVKEHYFLIIYKNIALTNVELTSSTNTIDGIKAYIDKNENAKKVNILYGNIESESEIIQSLGIQYLDAFKEDYYTYENDGESIYLNRQYFTATANDFQIYSSYIEEFPENSEPAVISSIIEKLTFFEEYSYCIIPISAIALILIFIYLIISIGYKRGVDGIALNDFDKIPLEIILVISVIIGFLTFVPLFTVNNDYSIIISCVTTEALVIYVLVAIILHTFIKRIKAKTLLKTTFFGKVILFVFKYLTKIENNIKNSLNAFINSTDIILKVASRICIFVVMALLILGIFQDSPITVILEICLAIYIFYMIFKGVIDFARIEKKVKEMYEGNNSNKLQEAEFISEFKNTVTYLNDISNGFENAVQDRMKSERLKAELITNVSHDIKTPLTSIINYVDLLKQEDIKNDKAKEYIGILDNKSQRLKKLTEDLVEASKVSTGNISLNLEKINVVELIKQAAGEFENKFEKRGLKTLIDSPTKELNVKADSRYMYRIIENLFSNVSKYALENSRVYVDIKEVNKSVIIEIKNISKDRLNISTDELMQRFVRGDKSRTTEGSGLGISITQNLTELQNGEFNLTLDGDLFKVQLKFELIK